MKNTFKRVLSLVLALVMIIGMAPAMTLHAHATALSGLTDTNIGLDYANSSSDSSWTASGTSITGKTAGKFTNNNSTLTITNNLKDGSTLSFDYNWTISDTGGDGVGQVIITDADGNATTKTASSGSGTFSQVLAQGASVTVYIQSGTTSNIFGSASTTTVNITNINLEAPAGSKITFKTAANGTYTVDGNAVSAQTENSYEGGTNIALVATPASGYQFVGWYDETAGTYLSGAATYTHIVSAAATIYPVFVPASQALFTVGSLNFEDLNAADAYATSSTLHTIVLANNGTLAAGDYTISSGNTLLIPFDSAYTIHTEGVDTAVDGTFTDTQGTYATPTPYRTLTMASGANITVNGALNVGGEHHAGSSAASGAGISGNSAAGSPTGPVGFINMASGSSITVQSGGNLYAWGFITGDGTVTAKSGAAVHETMQVADFRGGTATTSIVDNAGSWKFFPFSQYYVQNIEVPLTLEKGATEYATTTIYMSSNAFTSEVKFIGDGALFTITNGSVTKEYDGSRDRLNLTVNGTVGISSMQLTVSTMTINSGAYVLPINSNISINVLSGSVVNLTQDLALLPGSEVNVEQGASMNIPSGYNLYVYDGDQWGNYVFSGYQWLPVVYAPGKTYTRTQADVTADVKVDLNGSLSVTGGAYTTAGGANIYSSAGTGSVTMSAGAGTATETYQATQSSSDMTAVAIPITSVKLNNGTSYTETADAAAGDVYYWNSDCSKWMKNVQSGHSYESVTVDATCTEPGSITYTCSVCGNSYTETIPATGHSYESVTVDATCTEAGSTTYTCACGDTYTETIPATGHSYEAVVTAPTCTEDGYTTYTCACGDSYTGDIVAATGHSYESVVTAPTCTAAGYTTYTCSACGDTYTGDETAALGHTEVIDAAVAAACTTTGLTEGKHCSVCGTVTVAQTETAALGHSWDEGVIDPDATCTEEGVKTYTCGTCGETKTEAVSAKGHTEVADEAVAATCTTPGKTAGSHCSVCDAILSGNEEIPALGHSYTSSVTAPTCTAEGYTTYTCSACGDTYTSDTVAATGHSYNDVVTAPTCAEQGYTTYTCSACGDSYVADYVDALGHSYESVTVDATCTETGSTTYTCGTCGDTYSEVIAATGHSHTSVVTAPTCTEKGYTTYTCACGDSYVGDYVDALGHTWGDWTVVTEATCTEAGEQTRTCSACGTSETQSIAANGHEHVAVVTAPTCTSQGYTTHTCACGDSYVDSYVDQLGHSYSEWYNVSEADCTTDGLNQRDCVRCDHYETAVIPATGHSFTNYVDDHNGYETATCDNCDATDTKLKTGILAGGQCGDELYWELAEDGTMTISGTGEMWHFSEEPKPWLDYQSKIKKLVVEDGATTIGSEAFRDCSSLTTVTFPTTLKTIGYYSFDGCNLSNVVIPEGVTAIEAGAFNYSMNMGTLSLPSTLETIGDNAFAELYLSEGLVIPAGVTSIGKSAFAGYNNWSGDETITFLGNAPAIGENAFGYVTATCYYPANNASWTEDVMLDYGGTLTWVINCDHTDVVVDEAVAPTCTETGLTEGKHCSVCEEVLVAQEVVAATGEHVDENSDNVCDTCGESLQNIAVTLTAKEAMLDAEVILRFYLMIPDELLADENAKVVLTKDGRFGTVVKTYTMAELLEAGLNSYGEYEVEIGVASGEMTRDVTLEILDGSDSHATILDANGNDLGTVFTYKVTDYAKAIFTKGTERQKKVIAAMMVYGGYAQQYFKVDADNPAYSILPEYGIEIPSLDDVTAETITDDLVVAGAVEGMSYSAMEPFYDSAIYLRVYFKMEAGHTIDEYTFTLTYTENYVEKTMELEPEYDATYDEYYVDILDIPAAYLDYMYKVTVSNSAGEAYEVSTSVLVWAKKVIGRSSSSEAQVNLAKAMYYYNQAANVFFNK